MHRSVVRKWWLTGGGLGALVLLMAGTNPSSQGHPVPDGEVKRVPWRRAASGRTLVLHDIRSEPLMGLNRTVALPGEQRLRSGGWSDVGGMSAAAPSSAFLSAQPNMPTDSRRGILDGLEDAPVDADSKSWGWLETDVRAGTPDIPVERSDAFRQSPGYYSEDRAGGGSGKDEMFLFQRRHADAF
ncbi:MAG TPA: hypothetical protein DCS43_03465 [Verrucomicrobia bacterium]|nr:hypothetical protein [Verrucomicrobiota bacterium]